jgi:hypothetical protein
MCKFCFLLKRLGPFVFGTSLTASYILEDVWPCIQGQQLLVGQCCGRLHFSHTLLLIIYKDSKALHSVFTCILYPL